MSFVSKLHIFVRQGQQKYKIVKQSKRQARKCEYKNAKTIKDVLDRNRSEAFF